MSISYKTAHDHLLIAEELIKNPYILSHLKSSTVMMKSLHSTQLKTQEEVDSIKTTFDSVKSKQELELRNIVRPITKRQDRIKKAQEATYGQLREM